MFARLYLCDVPHCGQLIILRTDGKGVVGKHDCPGNLQHALEFDTALALQAWITDNFQGEGH